MAVPSTQQTYTIPFLCMTALMLGSPNLASADLLDDLKPGQWVELPCKNKIRSVLPTPLPPGNGPEKIIHAWNSGAYDTKRDRLVIWGGGHQDYQGNEIYAFDIATLTWSRLTNPSSFPVAVHTYDGVEYLARYDRLFSQGGSTWPTGYSTTTTNTFDMASLTWEKRANTSLGGMLGVVSAYNPVNGTIIWDGSGDSNGRLSIYDPVKDSWTIRGNDAVGNYHQTAAFDPKRSIFLRVGGGMAHYYDVTAAGTMTAKALSASGPGNMASVNYPGIEYDPVAEEFVAWHGGSDVYSLNMDAKAWSKTTGTGTNPGTAVEEGTFNRWRYVPSRNVFLVVNSIDGCVFAYRNKAGTSAPKAYLEMLTNQGTIGIAGQIPGTALGFSALPGAQGIARYRITGIAGAAPSTLRIHDSSGRTQVVLAGVPVGSGAVEYTWKNAPVPQGVFFAEGQSGGKSFRARLPAQP